MGSKGKLALQGAAVAVVVALLGLLVWKLANQSHPAAKAGQVAPGFSLPRLDAPGTLSLAQFQGKPVVLNFWASWCQPCKQEAPLFATASDRYRSKGVVFIGIDAEDFKSDARTFMRRYGVAYAVAHDGSGDVGKKRYGVTGYPETFFIDARGRIVQHAAGEVDQASLDAGIRQAIAG